MGNLRGGEVAWKTLYEQVLDLNSADLALMIGATPPENRTSSLYQRAKYLWEFHEYEDWADALDLIEIEMHKRNNHHNWTQSQDNDDVGLNQSSSWRTILPPMLHPQATILGGVRMREFRGSGAVIFMIRWFLSQEIIRHNITVLYDRFVVTRSDHYYLCQHNLSLLDPDYLWLPKGSNHGGVTD